MKAPTTLTITAAVLTVAATVYPAWLMRPAHAQAGGDRTWNERTPWGNPDLQGE